MVAMTSSAEASSGYLHFSQIKPFNIFCDPVLKIEEEKRKQVCLYSY